MRMRVVIGVLAAVVLHAGRARAQDPGDEFIELERRAFALLESKEWAKAIAAFEEQIAIFEHNPRPYYNIACAHALQGDTERAVTWLTMSVKHGWRNVAHMDQDSDLDALRETAGYKRLRAHLDQLEPILPRRLPIMGAAPAPSVARILADGFLARARLDLDPRLWDENQIRARLFGHYDRQMARLARYIAENGDARDAHLAGRERVRLASLYRFGAEEPAAEEIGAANVRLTAEEFIERWPTSPFLFEVQLWRAAAEPGLGALRALVRDAPRGAVSARARAELCVRDKPNRPALFRKFVDLYGTTPVGKELLRRTLWRARLEVDGLPEGIAFEPAMQQPRRGRLIVGVVVAGDEESEALARKHEGERLVLVVLGGEWKGVRAPIARDPRAAVELLGVPDAPMVLVFNDGKLSRD